MPLDRRLASELLSIGAVSLSPSNPFTWASGLRSPIYCDNRLTLSYPPVRNLIADGFAALIHEQKLQPDVIAGTATAGIPHAAWLADRLDLPMAYVRSSPKAHGQGNQIEGRIAVRQRVVVVEDLISTGISSRSVVETLTKAGSVVAGVVAIFSYGLPAAVAAFEEIGTPLYTLTTFSVLVDIAREQHLLTADAMEALADWQRNPQKWSEDHSQGQH